MLAVADLAGVAVLVGTGTLPLLGRLPGRRPAWAGAALTAIGNLVV